MNDGSERKYGSHRYNEGRGTSDCAYGCGCWVGDSRSGGPLGLDPLNGECPNNPQDSAVRLSGSQDYEIVVSQRIAALESQVSRLTEELRLHKPGKKILGRRIALLEAENNDLWGHLMNTDRDQENLIARYWKKSRAGRRNKRKHPLEH